MLVLNECVFVHCEWWRNEGWQKKIVATDDKVNFKQMYLNLISKSLWKFRALRDHTYLLLITLM